MSEFHEYPKWLPAPHGVVVNNAKEEAAVEDGRAIFKEIRSAQGTEKRIVGIKEGD